MAFKVFNAEGNCRATFKEASEAAILIAAFGDGATLRTGRMAQYVVWCEGSEDQSASESYDHVAHVAEQRIKEGKWA